MTLDLDELERLALAATPGAGPWRAFRHDDGFYSVLATGDGIATPIRCYIATAPRQEEAEYIAAASPDVALRLVEEVRQLRKLSRSAYWVLRMLRGGGPDSSDLDQANMQDLEDDIREYAALTGQTQEQLSGIEE